MNYGIWSYYLVFRYPTDLELRKSVEYSTRLRLCRSQTQEKSVEDDMSGLKDRCLMTNTATIS